MPKPRESCPRCGWCAGPTDRHCSLCGLIQRRVEVEPDVLLLAVAGGNEPQVGQAEQVGAEVVARSVGPQELRIFPVEEPAGVRVESEPTLAEGGVSLSPGSELRLRVVRTGEPSGIVDPVLILVTTAGSVHLPLRTAPLPPLSVEPKEISVARRRAGDEIVTARLRLERGSERLRLAVEGPGVKLRRPAAGDAVQVYGGHPLELVFAFTPEIALSAGGQRLVVALEGGGRMTLPLRVVERRPPVLVADGGVRFLDLRAFPGDVAEAAVELVNVGKLPYRVEKIEVLGTGEAALQSAEVVEVSPRVAGRVVDLPLAVEPSGRFSVALRCSSGHGGLLDATVEVTGTEAEIFRLPLRIDAREPAGKHFAPVAFDFGTSVSAIATRHRQKGWTGEVATLPFEDGGRQASFLPSDVRLRLGRDGQVEMVIDWLGAQGGADERSLGVAQNVKRRLGQTSREDAVEVVVVDGRRIDVPVEELAVFVVREMKRSAERFLDVRLHEVIATHPTRFSLHRIQALRQVYERAGFSAIHLMDEATAAGILAMRQLLSEKERYRMLVYDMGGGTTDVTLFEVENRKGATGYVIRPRVLGVTGKAELGGREVTAGMYRSFVEQLREEDRARIPLPEWGELDPDFQLVARRNRSALFARLDELKIGMFSAPAGESSASRELEIVLSKLDWNGHMVNYTVFERDRVQETIREALDEFWQELDELLDLGQVEELDVLYFAGRSSRLPIVHERLTERLTARYPRLGVYWAVDESRQITLKGAVSMGACIAQDLREGTADVLVLDNLDNRSASRFGYRSSNGDFIEMLGRRDVVGSPSEPHVLPISTRSRSDRYELRLEIFENGTLDPRVDGNAEAEPVGVAHVSFPAQQHEPESVLTVELRLLLDEDRRLHVDADLQGSKQRFPVET